MTRYHYHGFWLHAKEVSGIFKSLKLSKDDRGRLWASYSSLCDDVKGSQNIERDESKGNSRDIEFHISEAFKQANFADDREGLDEAMSMQSEALRLMKERRLFGEDRNRLWKCWLEANGRISQKRKEVQKSNYRQAEDEAGSCWNDAEYGNPHNTLKRIREYRESLHEVYIDKEQRHYVYNILDKAWERALARIGELKEENIRKHEEWRKRTEGNLNRWETNIEKSEQYISSLEGQISRLEVEESDAKTDDHAERVRGWIEEKQEKIAEVMGQIKEWEEKIYSARGKIDE